MEEDKGFDSFPVNHPTHDLAHERPENLDPKVNGPFLDDVRREQEEAYRAGRLKSLRASEKKKERVAKKTADKKAEANNGTK